MPPATLFFLHVPKTAGRYVVSVALNHELREGPFLPPGKLYRGTPSGRMHYGGHNVVRRDLVSPIAYFAHSVQDAPGWRESVRFTVIRNPFDLLVSMYIGAWPDGATVTRACFPTFADFVTAYCDPKYPWRVPAMQANLYFQLFDEAGQCPLHTILRQEALDDELEALCGPLGIRPIRGEIHKASRFNEQRDHRAYYDDALRELVEKKCRFELDWAGYDFDGLGRGDRALDAMATRDEAESGHAVDR